MTMTESEPHTAQYVGGAIVTRYIGPSDTRGGRIVAISGAGRGNSRVVVSWDHALDIVENHEHAARFLARRLGYTDPTMVVELPDTERGKYAFMGHKAKG